MEQYLIRKDKSKERRIVTKIAEIDKRTATELDGNVTFKTVEIIRLLASSMEKTGGDGRGIFLYAWEDPICNEPFLKVYVLPDRWGDRIDSEVVSLNVLLKRKVKNE